MLLRKGTYQMSPQMKKRIFEAAAPIIRKLDEGKQTQYEQKVSDQYFDLSRRSHSVYYS
jgi:hypothetical protein